MGSVARRLGLVGAAVLVTSLSCAPFAMAEAGSYRLWAGETLHAGEKLVSPHAAYSLVMQPDGDLVEVSSTGRRVWASGTKIPQSVLQMQSDGNAVIYAPGHVAIWESNSAGSGAQTIEVQDDENLVLYASGHVAVWATGQIDSAFASPLSPDSVGPPAQGGANTNLPSQSSSDVDAAPAPKTSPEATAGATRGPVPTSFCPAYTNGETWQTSTQWGRVRERPCVQYTDNQARAMVEFQVDWPADCSLTVGLPPSVGAGCPAKVVTKLGKLTFKNVKITSSWKAPDGQSSPFECNWTEELTAFNMQNTTFDCYGPWSPIQSNGQYAIRIDGVQADVKDDGAGQKTLAPLSYTVQALASGGFVPST